MIETACVGLAPMCGPYQRQAKAVAALSGSLADGLIGVTGGWQFLSFREFKRV